MKKWLKYHRWLKLTFVLVFGGIAAISHFWPRPEVETVHGFAALLRNMIVEGRIKDFDALPCVPNDCSSDDHIAFVFGRNGKDSVVRNLLTNPGTEVKIYGPLRDAEATGGETYVIIYYDPARVTFDRRGHLWAGQREKLWWKGYVETRAVRRDGVWGFFETPFYYGVHLPFVEDYG